MDFQSLAIAYQSAAAQKVLVIGDVFLDEYLYGSIQKVSTGIKIPIIRKKESLLFLGGAGNIAKNISNLSRSVTCCGIIGNDSYSKEILRLLKKNNIKFRGLTVDGDSSVKRRIYVDSEQVSRLDYQVEPAKVDDLVCSILDNETFDFVVVADYNQGVVTQSVLDILKRKRIKIFFTSRSLAEYIVDGIDCVLASRDDCNQMRIDDLVRRVNSVVYTRGMQGILYIEKGKKIEVPSEPATEKNVSGAGDTVCSVFAVFNDFIKDRNLLLKLCSIAGAIAVEYPWTYSVTFHAILERLWDNQVLVNSFNKITTVEFAKTLVDAWRVQGHQIVFTNGCFDLLHLGHLHSLKMAKKMGTKLVVAVNSDASVKYLKGENRPLINLETRLRVLSMLECVDLLVSFDGHDAVNVIKEIKPDVYAKGSEYLKKNIPEQAFAKRMEYIPMLKGISTTLILDKIKGR